MAEKQLLTDDEYTATGGNQCPHCHSTNVQGGRFDVESNVAWRDVECGDCNETWCDQFILVGWTAN